MLTSLVSVDQKGDPLYVAGGRPREDLNTVNAENCEDKSMDPADDG